MRSRLGSAAVATLVDTTTSSIHSNRNDSHCRPMPMRSTFPGCSRTRSGVALGSFVHGPTSAFRGKGVFVAVRRHALNERAAALRPLPRAFAAYHVQPSPHAPAE
jgi:hypothetical protein